MSKCRIYHGGRGGKQIMIPKPPGFIPAGIIIKWFQVPCSGKRENKIKANKIGEISSAD
jgi:hypothetical protein